MKRHSHRLFFLAVLILALPACSTTPQAPPTLSVEQAAATLVAMNFAAATQSAALPKTALAPIATATLGSPIFYVNGNIQCRSGPGPNFRVLASFTPGTVLNMLGKDPSGNYWLVKDPNSSAVCWLLTVDGTPGGSFASLPVVTPQPSTQKPPGIPASLSWPFYCEYEHDVTYKVTIQLSWTDLGHDANGFRVYREGAQVADLPAATPTYKDSVDVTIGSQLSYSVEAYNDAGVSPRSSVTITSICK